MPNRIVISFVSLFTLLLAVHASAAEKQISGWIERVAVTNQLFVLKAKIDTGAKHSSIHSDHFSVFNKEGVKWLRFTATNKKGESLQLERPLLRYTQIKQKRKHAAKSRPVVLMGICLSNVYKTVEVNVVDRGNFNYHMLIGRSFLKGDFVVDSDAKFITEPKCKPS